MWWKVNLSKFAGQLVPPVLRSSFLTGLLQAFLAPLRSIVERFNTDRTTRLEDIRTTPQAGVLEVLLNSRFGYPDVDPPIIRVETFDDKVVRLMFTKQENMPVFMRMETEVMYGNVYWLRDGEVSGQYNIRVVVPKLLQDEAARISDFVQRHVAAGRTWYIDWYDY